MMSQSPNQSGGRKIIRDSVKAQKLIHEKEKFARFMDWRRMDNYNSRQSKARLKIISQVGNHKHINKSLSSTKCVVFLISFVKISAMFNFPSTW